MDIEDKLKANWQYVAGIAFEKMLEIPENYLEDVRSRKLHVGPDMMCSRMLVGDGCHPFSCHFALSFGKQHISAELPRKKSSRETMFSIDSLGQDIQDIMLHYMFYMGLPISVVKNRYGLNRGEICPRSLSDALSQVGLSAEEVLIKIDLQNA